MSRLKSKNTDWVDLLRQSLALKEIRPIGKGWMTRREIKKLWNVGDNMTGKMIATFVKKGSVEIFTGRVTNDKGINVVSVWYRIKRD